MSVKQEALNLIKKLPSNTSVEDIIYELYFKQKVDRGLKDLKADRVTDHEKVMTEMKKWLQK